MANFIDFVVEVSKKKALGKEFKTILEKSSPKELTEWFTSKGYTVSEEESGKLFENKDTINKTSTLKNY